MFKNLFLTEKHDRYKSNILSKLPSYSLIKYRECIESQKSYDVGRRKFLHPYKSTCYPEAYFHLNDNNVSLKVSY